MFEQELDDWIDEQLESDWDDLCVAEGCDGPDSDQFPAMLADDVFEHLAYTEWDDYIDFQDGDY